MNLCKFRSSNMLKLVFLLSGWTLVMGCDNSGFGYKIQAYRKRHYKYISCSLYQTTVQGDINCGRVCNSHRSTCYFFLLDGNDCIVCNSDGGSLTPSNYTLTEHDDKIIYEKQDNEDGCNTNPCTGDDICADDLFGYACMKCTGTICVRDPSSCLVTYGPYGSSGGYPINDASLKDNGFITAIHIVVGQFYDCIGMTYGDTQGPCHGGQGQASPATVTLAPGEYITAVSGGPDNSFLTQLTFITNFQRTLPFGSYSGDHAFDINSGGRVLAYISGRAGRLIDQISFHFYC